MKTEELNKIIEKSKTRNNGVYSHKGNLFMVIDNFPKYVSENGTILQLCGNFVTTVGHCEPYKLRNKMMQMFKELSK